VVSRSSWRRRARRVSVDTETGNQSRCARVGNDQLGEVHDADTGPGRGRPERVTGPVIIELASHSHGAGVQVDRRPQSAEVSPRHRDWPRRLRRASYDS
jgi:hypothetical protein